MKTEVFITTPILNTTDLDEIKKSLNTADADFELVEEHGLLGESILKLLYILAPGIGASAAYDLIKHSVLAVLAKVNEKLKGKEDEGTKLVVEVCKRDSSGKLGDRKVVTVSTSYKMSEDERERTISKLLGNSFFED